MCNSQEKYFKKLKVYQIFAAAEYFPMISSGNIGISGKFRILLHAIFANNKRPHLLFSTVKYSSAQLSTVQYSKVHFSTVQFSTVQYSTVQRKSSTYSTYSTVHVQYSTVHMNEVRYSQTIGHWIGVNTEKYAYSCLSRYTNSRRKWFFKSILQEIFGK